jgi:hypothetical protein
MMPDPTSTYWLAKVLTLGISLNIKTSLDIVKLGAGLLVMATFSTLALLEKFRSQHN